MALGLWDVDVFTGWTVATQGETNLCLLSAGIKGIYHHAQLLLLNVEFHHVTLVGFELAMNS